MIRVQRVYDAAGRGSGTRVLVDRLWPRGIKKEALSLDYWARDVSPSDRLRHWFGHRAERWAEFRRRYFAELDEHPGAWAPLLEMARERDLLLLFGASETEHNNAVALKEYLEAKLRRRASSPRAAKSATPRKKKRTWR